jgi:hypothetical protein
VDTISDFLLSLGAEMDYSVSKFNDRPITNEIHPLIARLNEIQVEYKQPQRPRLKFQRLTRPETNAEARELVAT